MADSTLDDIRSVEWERDEDGGGVATLLVKPSAKMQRERYEFDDLTELPDSVEAVILDEGTASGRWSAE